MRTWRHRSRIGPIVVTIGAAIAIVFSLADWLRSGAVERSSYETLGMVHRLGFAPSEPVKTVIRLWPLMPLLVASAAVTAWWGWRIVAAVVGVIGGLYAAVLGGTIAAAVPESSEVGISAAPALTCAGGVVVVVGSLLCVIVRVPSGNAHPR